MRGLAAPLHRPGPLAPLSRIADHSTCTLHLTAMQYPRAKESCVDDTKHMPHPGLYMMRDACCQTALGKAEASILRGVGMLGGAGALTWQMGVGEY